MLVAIFFSYDALNLEFVTIFSISLKYYSMLIFEGDLNLKRRLGCKKAQLSLCAVYF